ncbi:hypothetical protein SDJN02_22338 [Cucurbita argyrosperma subsp. argyrosperma]|nr:hypothetical protein SDJN02_22338 [Cucurbita argyrosperma subsp. argyrosperma]
MDRESLTNKQEIQIFESEESSWSNVFNSSFHATFTLFFFYIIFRCFLPESSHPSRSISVAEAVIYGVTSWKGSEPNF